MTEQAVPSGSAAAADEPQPYRSAFLALPGAVEGVGIDAGVAWHYGQVTADQRDLAAGRSVVDASHLGILRLTGGDRLSWLDSLTSQRLTTLQPGESAETLLLDIQGHIEHGAAVVDDGAATWLITERDFAPAFAAWLNRMRFMLDVQVAEVTGEFAVMATLGELDLGAAAPNGTPLVWSDPWAAPPEHGWSYSPYPVVPAEGITDAHPGADFPLKLHVVERARLQTIVDRAASGELPIAGMHALEALRIAAWRPRLGAEVDSRAIPHEFDWLRSAVHLEKGCYRGQETVAKVHFLGRPPRRIVLLDLDGSLGELPEAGSTLSVEGDAGAQTVGRISSVAIHHEDGPIALALVKRSLPEDATLVAHLADEQQVTASATTIVSPGAGRAAEVPRLPRLERRGQ
ncbi:MULTISPECIES: YgfZ/GcvT domain-containing protein [unclassified Pseudoclavibacter]|uniref:CAF17-like 4Fe-4S cluster assembly/insertion protein YgfZ n=1 Tax=unclassified Pseudoclavibacter TaxID=2615177 RepID=UPI001BA5A41B|nr:folate-binding protein YgfZ [Pseudoclavibacter sp. Marseille-Q4354]MBS3177308.1 folate-binding protein YgfZ [Pseudoclavibacter sp. Marseille-Q4354]